MTPLDLVALKPPHKRTATCNRCGDCCRVVVIMRSKTKILQDNIPEGDRRWLREDLTRISWARAAELRSGWGPGRGAYYYTCRNFTADGCALHSNGSKPSCCKGFPWYGGTPGITEKSRGRLAWFPRCSFWFDIPEELWPEHVQPEEAQ